MFNLYYNNLSIWNFEKVQLHNLVYFLIDDSMSLQTVQDMTFWYLSFNTIAHHINRSHALLMFKIDIDYNANAYEKQKQQLTEIIIPTITRKNK